MNEHFSIEDQKREVFGAMTAIVLILSIVVIGVVGLLAMCALVFSHLPA